MQTIRIAHSGRPNEPEKQKEKERRRARKLAAEAWEAADAGNLDLAEKIIRRAVAAQEDNPVLWNDQGVLLALRHKNSEAADSFRAALSLAPNFADPYSHLAALRVRQGFTKEAAVLQAQAVEYSANNAVYVERLRAYQALAGQECAESLVAPIFGNALAVATGDNMGDLESRLQALDWHALDM